MINKKSALSLLTIIIAVCTAMMTAAPATALDKPTYKICWSIYAGWMPWGYAEDVGIVQKWAERYNMNIDIVLVDDYIDSINRYTAKEFDGCTMTNMDALTIPAAEGLDTTAIVVGDFSFGNDAIVVRNARSLPDIQGMRVGLVEYSVSHYLVARALDMIGLTEKDIRLEPMADAELVDAYQDHKIPAVATWNPLLSEIKDTQNSKVVFSSQDIPGEIIDLLVVNTETLNRNPNLGSALAGAWYEVMSLMQKDDRNARTAKFIMGVGSGTDLKGFEAQLNTTQMFYDPERAVIFTNGSDLLKTMEYVAEFSFHHGLLGKRAKSAQHVGIKMPAGTYGSTANIKLRFEPRFMHEVAERNTSK